MIVVGRVPLRRPDEELGAGQGGAEPADHDEERQAPLRRLPRRCLHAHAAARPGRRADALDDLLRVPRPARASRRCSRSTTSSRRTSSSSTAARTRRTPSSVTPPASCSSAACCGRSLRRYVQRPYRIRIKTQARAPVILGTFLVIGVSGFAAEMFRIALQSAEGEDMDFEQWSFVGYPLSTLVDGWSVVDARHVAPAGRGSPTSSRSSPSSPSCRSRCCGTCSRRR